MAVLNITFQNFFQKVNENFERRRTLGIFWAPPEMAVLNITFQNFFQKVNEIFERRRTLGIFPESPF
jgi:hypothetical protein